MNNNIDIANRLLVLHDPIVSALQKSHPKLEMKLNDDVKYSIYIFSRI
jgi:hypothetical protein